VCAQHGYFECDPHLGWPRCSFWSERCSCDNWDTDHTTSDQDCECASGGETACADGIDNDNDSLADCNDPDCEDKTCVASICCLGGCSDTGCTGSCIDTDTDKNNCGECGEVCTGVDPGCCGGSCKDLDSDKHYCGSCTNDCTTDYGDKNDPNNQCSNGVCCDPNAIRLSLFTATSGGTPLTSQGFRLLWQLAGVAGLAALAMGGIVWGRRKRR